ncbi:unnamed protein product [Didymodactylos carnosus]|uniref:Uncharacterized protein n=1 Tax=Didymodactylos carnosus TaxID=1234261 RepID=A0A8S2E179_9BILA|nr:unnamed protein product [Didymodactylos carnosus]CAF3870074.1 unnamed protein product [Didymodactylos carnosus]
MNMEKHAGHRKKVDIRAKVQQFFRKNVEVEVRVFTSNVIDVMSIQPSNQSSNKTNVLDLQSFHSLNNSQEDGSKIVTEFACFAARSLLKSNVSRQDRVQIAYMLHSKPFQDAEPVILHIQSQVVFIGIHDRFLVELNGSLTLANIHGYSKTVQIFKNGRI